MLEFIYRPAAAPVATAPPLHRSPEPPPFSRENRAQSSARVYVFSGPEDNEQGNEHAPA